MASREVRWFRLLVVLSLLTGLVGMSSTAFADVNPPSVEAELPRGGSMQVEKTVTTPAIPPIVDICLLQDETGSFFDDVPNLVAAAPALYDTIVATAPGAQFAVAGFRDFPISPFGDPGDWVYRMIQTMDPDKADWLAGVGELGAGGGADTPEAQYNAIVAAAGPGVFNDPTLGPQLDCGWRDVPGVQRVLVVTTDAPFHTAGEPGDPGFLDHAAAVGALSAQKIKVIGLKAPGAGSELDNLVAAVGGSVQPLSSDGANIADAILAALEAITTDVWWDASCDTGLQVSLDPAVHYDVAGSTAVNFLETISLASDAPAGYLSCTVTFIANSYPEEGAPIGTQSIRIKVKDPVCPTDAAIDLEKLVNGEDADAPTGPEVLVGDEVVFTFKVTNNGWVPLIGIMVADDKLGTICKAAKLAPGESMECKKTATALEGLHANRAKVGATCLAPNGRKNAVKDIDLGHYLGILAPPPGEDIVVYNDINPFDIGGMENPNNPLMVTNLVDFTNPNPRGAGTVVWFDRGRNSKCGGTGECSDAALASMIATINAAGYSITEINSTSGSIVSIPGDVKTIFLWNPLVPYTTDEINTFKQFASEGGRLVFVGEWDDYYGAGIALENQFLLDMGAVMTNTGGAVDCSYNDLPAASLRAHQITTGMAGVRVACASVIAPGPQDYPFLYDSSNTLVLAGVAKIDTTPLPLGLIERQPLESATVEHEGLNPDSSTGY